MKFKERDILLSVLFSIFSCGIYLLYWEFSILSDLYKLNEKDENITLDIVLLILTCGIYAVVIWYKIGKLEKEYLEKIGKINVVDNTMLYIVLILLGFIIANACIVQNNFNNLNKNN